MFIYDMYSSKLLINLVLTLQQTSALQVSNPNHFSSGHSTCSPKPGRCSTPTIVMITIIIIIIIIMRDQNSPPSLNNISMRDQNLPSPMSNMLIRLITSQLYLHEGSKFATPYEQYVGWGSNINFISS